MIVDQPNGIPHRTIMVVDNNASDLGFLSNVLETAGYRVRSATDGRSALRDIRQKLPDLILLDIQLPDMDGIAVCRQLKADAQAREIPVIFTSVSETSHVTVNALKAGGVDHVAKPIDAFEILVRIENHLATYRLRQELAKQSEQLLAEIEARKQAEKAQGEHQMIFREMIDGFALHETVRDDHGEVVDYRFLAVNPAFEEMTGLRGDAIIGKRVMEVLPHTEPHWVRKFGRVAMTGEPDTFEAYSRAFRRHFQVKAFSPAIGQFACIFVDITDRKRADEDLKNLQLQLSNAVEMAHLGHWEYDVGSDIFTFNDHFYKIFRTTAEAVGGYRMSSAEYAERFVHPDDRVLVGMAIQKAIAVTDPDVKHRLEHRMVYSDGSIGHISVMFFLVKDDRGNTVKTYGVNQDITEFKQNEVRLQEAQKMESVGNLAGGIAHDFNNILFPIIGLSEMLMENFPTHGMEYENMQHILKAAERGSDLVQQILAFSRQSEHEMSPLRLQHILKEVLKLIRATIPANIEILQDIQRDCGLIMGDSTQLHQVVMNLMTNAYHAVEETDGKISVQLAEVRVDDSTGVAGKPGPYARLSVSDTGCGIDREFMDRIFEPYFTTKKKGKGTGLGLAVVYGIIREHGGDIKVHSEVGVGSTFHVYLPLMKKTFERKSDTKMERPQGGRERILLVDDEEAIILLLKQVLNRLGYRVTSFVSSVEAFDSFRTDPDGFDLLFTDMAMPHMTGEDLVRKILTIREDIPVILCTGYSERISRKRAHEIGIKGFLNKPISKSEMARMVRKVLDEAKGTV
jgi:PAS domain S-box-containing protein